MNSPLSDQHYNNVAFDQFQRYKNVADAIESMRKANEQFTILEVGANEHRNLEKFLPRDSIKYLDIELPADLQKHPDYILGDATKMEFSNDYFDIVVALDVFEHIPPDKRDDFISEIHRVSSEFYIITAPFASPSVSKAERRTNAVYKSLVQEDYRWLAEHFENGLPVQKDLEMFLNKLGVNYRVLSHGSLPIWESMMEIHFVAACFPELQYYRMELDRFYNANIFAEDYAEDSYRKIFICSKDRGMSELIEKRSLINMAPRHLEELQRFKTTFFSLATMLVNKKIVETEVQDKSVQDKIQVFTDSGKGFNEEESFKIDVDENRPIHKFLWNNSRMEPIKSIRIDPSDRKGIFKFDNITIRNQQGELVEEYFEDGNYIYSFDDIYGFSNDDPFLILNFSKPVSIDSISFDVTSLTKDERKLILEVEKVFLGISRLQETNKRITLESNNRLDKIRYLNNQLHQSELDKQKKEQFHKQEIQHNEQSIMEVKQALEDRNREYETLESELNKAHQQLQDVENSKFWKMAKLIKKLVGK